MVQLSRFVQCPDAPSKASGANDVLAPRACTERSQGTRRQRVRAGNHKASKDSRAQAVDCPLRHSHSGAHAACALKARRGARERGRAQECKQVHAHACCTRAVRARGSGREGPVPFPPRGCLTARSPGGPLTSAGVPARVRVLPERTQFLSQAGRLVFVRAGAGVRACSVRAPLNAKQV